MSRPRIISGDDDASIVRRARRAYTCASFDSHRSPDCQRTIAPGAFYIEWVGSTPLYQTGERYCMACAPRNCGIVIDDGGAR